ncbi:MAG: hypothetical protein U0X40_04425 [Ferruginibacter sp.]
MKKMFTLLVTLTVMTTAFAQYDRGNQPGYGNGSRDAVYNKRDGYGRDNDRFFDRDAYNKRQMMMEIDQINREYDHKIHEVNEKFFMPRFKKEQISWRLEQQRKQEIQQVYNKYACARNDRGRDWDDGHRKNW